MTESESETEQMASNTNTNTNNTFVGVVRGTLHYGEPGQSYTQPDGTILPYRVYAPGETFETSDAKLFTELRAKGALLLQSEARSAEETEAQQRQLSEENAALMARIGELEHLLGVRGSGVADELKASVAQSAKRPAQGK